MQKLPNPLSALLLPALGLGALVAEIYEAPNLSASAQAEQPEATANRKAPASLDRTRLITIRCQYRYYQRSYRRPETVPQAKADYNECVDDSDPTVLRGTTLPGRLD